MSCVGPTVPFFWACRVSLGRTSWWGLNLPDKAVGIGFPVPALSLPRACSQGCLHSQEGCAPRLLSPAYFFWLPFIGSQGKINGRKLSTARWWPHKDPCRVRETGDLEEVGDVTDCEDPFISRLSALREQQSREWALTMNFMYFIDLFNSVYLPKWSPTGPLILWPILFHLEIQHGHY